MRSQHVGDPDERQTDDGGRVDALHAREQRNTESFAFEAAGAVERRLRVDISLDLGLQKFAEHAARVIHVLRPHARFDADDRDGCVEGHRVSRETTELCDLCGSVARFAEWLLAECANLVGADDERVRFAFGDGAGLGECEARGEGPWRLTRQVRLVDVGRAALERQPEAGEQFAPIA